MALNPEYLEKLPREITALYSSAEQNILQDIARRIAKNAQLSSIDVYQINRFRELGAMEENIKKELSRLSGATERKINQIFEQAGRLAYEADRPIFERQGIPFRSYEENLAVQQMVNAVSLNTRQTFMNMTNTTALNMRVNDITLPLPRAFTKIMDQASYNTLTGLEDYNTAITRAINQMGDSGIAVVNYNSGRNESIDSVVRRAVLTSLGQLSGQIAMNNVLTLGAEHVQVTAHQGARIGEGIANHEGWQGRVYKLKGSDEKYGNFFEITGYGDVAGLHGANCRHDFNPFFPDIDEPLYTEDELQSMHEQAIETKPFQFTNRYGEEETRELTLREQLDYQRHLERRMRKLRSKARLGEIAGSNQVYDKNKARYVATLHRYQNFSDTMGIKQDLSRVYMDGIGRL